mmetsp:Transcript_48452/g.113485  ORF Transcript_48452/g.113485 Transcript_48452/m.113485 type:complete len:160 (-) Transcript_48452:1217-1696(-)
MPASVNPELKPNLAELKSHLDTTARLTKQMVPVVNLSTLRPKSSAGSRRHQSGRLLHMRVCHSTGLRQNMVLQIQDVPIARSPCAEDEQEHDHHEHDMPAAPVPKNIIDRTSLLKAGNVHVEETEADPKIRMACSNRKVVTSVHHLLASHGAVGIHLLV